jgi:hypothetical protein
MIDYTMTVRSPKTAVTYRTNLTKPEGPSDRVWIRGTISLCIDCERLLDILAQEALTSEDGTYVMMQGAIKAVVSDRTETVEPRGGS